MLTTGPKRETAWKRSVRQDGRVATENELQQYARAAAAMAGLAIDEAWWPGVIGHLGALMHRVESLASAELELPEDLGPVFQP